MSKTVQRAGIHQALEALAVHVAGHTLYKVVNVCEQAVFLPLLYYGFHDVGAKALDGTERKTNVSVLVHGEVAGALVDVRVQHFDAVAFAIVHYLGDFFHGLGAVKAGGKEFRGVVGLEPAGLVAHPGVAGCVGLVKGILGKLFPVFPDLVQDLFRVAVCHSSSHKLVLEGVQDVDLLFAHGLAELVCLAFGEAGKFL